MSKTLDEILEHHGIKGMHWGVRRSRGSDGLVGGSSKKTSSHPLSDDAKRAQETHARIKSAGGTHVVSNQDLQHLVNRMNLEQQFSRLSLQNGSRAGSKFAKEILTNVGKQQITKLASDAVTKAIGTALKK